MRRFWGKLGFIHRRLWLQDGLYRGAFVFGPTALAGVVLAGATWAGFQALGGTARTPPPPWATPIASERPVITGEPETVSPEHPLPATNANGSFDGFETGWRVTTNPLEVKRLISADIKRSPLTVFDLAGPSFDMGQIIAAGPKTGLYAAIGKGFLAVRTAGVYALTASLERPPGPVADCLVRFGLGQHRIVAALNSDLAAVSRTFDAVPFKLQAGLYSVGWAFACWHDREVVDTGQLTILVGHPGEEGPAPAHTGDFVWPKGMPP